jgi:hypothetical protein
MTVRGSSCVPDDRLTAHALLAQTPESDQDRQLVAHLAECEGCARRFADLTSQFDGLRSAAWQEADAHFDDIALDAQRSRILERIAHIGQAARILRFPARAREVAMPVSPISRRWVSVAAAAGLLIGLVAGQLIHFVPWEVTIGRPTQPLQITANPRGSAGGGMILQATTTLGSDEELLDEIDDAMELRRAATLRALDAFTPRVEDLVEIR